tara:strand:- start:1454 stop:2797 length:1344 start_codon:yes stop_codon:yes gene_type:complete
MNVIKQFISLNSVDLDKIKIDQPALSSAIDNVLSQLALKYPQPNEPEPKKIQTVSDKTISNIPLPWKSLGQMAEWFEYDSYESFDNSVDYSYGPEGLVKAINENVLPNLNFYVKNPGSSNNMIMKGVITKADDDVKSPRGNSFIFPYTLKLFNDSNGTNYLLCILPEELTKSKPRNDFLSIFIQTPGGLKLKTSGGTYQIYRLPNNPGGRPMQTGFELTKVEPTPAYKNKIRQAKKSPAKKTSSKSQVALPKTQAGISTPAEALLPLLKHKVMMVNSDSKTLNAYIYDAKVDSGGEIDLNIYILFNGDAAEYRISKDDAKNLAKGLEVEKIRSGGSSYTLRLMKGGANFTPAAKFPETYPPLDGNQNKRKGPDQSAKKYAQVLQARGYEPGQYVKLSNMKAPPFVAVGNNGNFWYLTLTNKGAYRWTEKKGYYTANFLKDVVKYSKK